MAVNRRFIDGGELTRIRANQDANDERRRLAQPLSSAYVNYGRLQAARANYTKLLQKAIRGQQGPLFRNQTPTGSLVMNDSKFSVGDNLASMYAAGNQPLISKSRKLASDTLSASMFMHPETDILAYHRRIERPEVFSHEPRFGF